MNAAARQDVLGLLQEGTHSAVAERMDWSYYDRLTLAAAGTVFPLFQVPVGQAGKTLADTNMTLAGLIPSNQNFRIRSIRAEYAAHAVLATASIQLMYAFLYGTTISLIINGKAPTFQRPLSEIIGLPIYGVCTPTVAGDSQPIFSLGRGTGILPLNMPITLAGNTNFEVRVEYAAALGAVAIAGDFLKISLNGILDRAS